MALILLGISAWAQELGSFTFSKRDRENIFFDVNITWFK